MKDLAIRVWDSEEKKMIYIDDLYFFKDNSIHTMGENGNNNRFKEPIMLASPYYDKMNNVRLYENDIVECYYCRDQKGIGIVEMDNYRDRGWIISKSGTWESMYDFLGKNHYIKIGDIYSNPEIIPNYRKKLKEQAETEKREKELQCLMKLKAKYENTCESEV
jgi:hypothetical protein